MAYISSVGNSKLVKSHTLILVIYLLQPLVNSLLKVSVESIWRTTVLWLLVRYIERPAMRIAAIRHFITFC